MDIKKLKRACFFASMISVGAIPSIAPARVFDIKKETIGSYFKVDYTPSSLGTTMYSLSSGTGTQFAPPGVDYHTAFELGFIYTYKMLSMRLGIESVHTKPLTFMSGTNAGGTALMSIDSSATTIAPVLHFDLNLYQGEKSRLYIGLGGGQVTLTGINDYTFTAAGLSAFPGVANYREQIQSQFISGVVTMGFEFIFADTTTMSLELGYRNLNGVPLIHQLAIPQNVDGGAISVGDPAKNSDGSDRTLDMTGPFLGVAYRFYVSIL